MKSFLSRSVTRWLAPLVSLVLVVGCGATQSYRYTVKNAYPVVADRMDKLQRSPNAEAVGLRAAAEANTVTYPVAKAAWNAARPVYRSLVQLSPGLTDHRRVDWLKTADLLDTLQAQEARHANIFLRPFTPPPTTVPVGQ